MLLSSFLPFALTAFVVSALPNGLHKRHEHEAASSTAPATLPTSEIITNTPHDILSRAEDALDARDLVARAKAPYTGRNRWSDWKQSEIAALEKQVRQSMDANKRIDASKWEGIAAAVARAGAQAPHRSATAVCHKARELRKQKPEFPQWIGSDPRTETAAAADTPSASSTPAGTATEWTKCETDALERQIGLVTLHGEKPIDASKWQSIADGINNSASCQPSNDRSASSVHDKAVEEKKKDPKKIQWKGQ